MATTEITKLPERTDVGEAATVMAIGIVVERVSRLPAEDKKDLLELVKELSNAQTREDYEAIRTAMVEILDQESSGVAPMEDLKQRSGRLQKWVDFISAKIRELRTSKGWTQEELAEKSGLPQSHISRLEGGQHSPSFMTIDKLAKAFGVDVRTLDPSR